MKFTLALAAMAVVSYASILEVNTALTCKVDADCDQNAYMLSNSTMTRDFSWLGLGQNLYSAGINVCCATFPHLGSDGKSVVTDKYCYPRTVLNMEQD